MKNNKREQSPWNCPSVIITCSADWGDRLDIGHSLLHHTDITYFFSNYDNNDVSVGTVQTGPWRAIINFFIVMKLSSPCRGKIDALLECYGMTGTLIHPINILRLKMVNIPLASRIFSVHSLLCLMGFICCLFRFPEKQKKRSYCFRSILHCEVLNSILLRGL